MTYNCSPALFFFASIFFSAGLEAQAIPDFKFGHITASDFGISSPVIDSTSDAVLLCDIGTARLESYVEGWKIVFTRFRRIRILNQRGLSAATIKIGYSAENNNDGKLKTLRASTYNLKNGQVEVTEVATKDFFTEQAKKSDWIQEKFTFPNVTAGSIIEYSYTIKSPDIDELHPWEFQGEYPRIWSQYTTILPQFFNYAVILKGSLPLFNKSADSVSKEINFGSGSMEAMIYSNKWTMKDVPAIKQEPFVYSMSNHVAAIHFQISMRPVTSYRNENVLTSWQNISDRLLGYERFGKPIANDNSWLSNDLARITSGSLNDLDRARKIFAFARDSLKKSGDGIFLYTGLKDIYTEKTGNVAEINLLLIAMLRQAKILADPLILSTRDNGLTNAAYPVLDNINYVIARVRINNQEYYLDASEKNLGFGKLPLRCYNGHARLLARVCIPIYLSPDSLQEISNMTIFVTNDDSSNMTASCIYKAGYYESLEWRNEHNGQKQEYYFKTIGKSFPFPVVLDNAHIDSLQEYDKPINASYDMKFTLGSDEIIYFNPMFNEAVKENPFKSDTRQNTIEMPYAINNMYVLNMEIPNGYVVDELPKSTRLNLGEHDGSFEYMIANTGTHILLQCRLSLNKAIFETEDYASLRSFYTYVVKKESENIVFKKVVK